MLTVVIGGAVALGLSAVARRRPAAARLALLLPPALPSASGASFRPVRSKTCSRTGRVLAGSLPGSLSATLSTALARADLAVSPPDAVVVWMAVTGTAGVLALSVTGPVGAFLAVAAGLASGPAVLWALRHRREERLAAAVPDVLEEIARELRAGGTVLSALERLAGRPGLMGAEAAALRKRISLGLPVDETLTAWAGSHEQGAAAGAVRMAAVALQVATGTGGRAAGSLSALAASMRDETSVLAEARAQAAQGRMSALLLGVLPVGSLVVSAVLDPGSVDVLMTHPLGRFAFAAGLALDAAGVLWMRRIVRVTS